MAKLVPVNSSMFQAMSWDIATKKLVVQFPGGEVGVFYAYQEVPAQVVAAVMFADSSGTAFDELVKKGGFKYEKITPEEAFGG